MTKYKLNEDGDKTEPGSANSRFAQRRFDSINGERSVRPDVVLGFGKEGSSSGMNDGAYNGGLRNMGCYVKHSEECLRGVTNNAYVRGCDNGDDNFNPGYLIDMSGETITDDNPIVKFGRWAKRSCSMKTLKKRVPIISWLPNYNLKFAISDMIAGLTVGLTVIPQAIAYANVAGLPPQFGLYSSFMACFIYTIFGSCKDSAVGPTAIAAILTRENIRDLSPEFAVALCFLSGCVIMLMGLLQLGALIDFISGPVSIGFTSAAAIIIALTQVKDILGLKISGGKLLDVVQRLYENIQDTRPWDATLGIICIIVLLLLRKIKDIPACHTPEREKSGIPLFFSNFLWGISIGRNIIVVIISAVLAYGFSVYDQYPFILTGEVKGGLPNVTLPPFEITTGNHTYEFFEIVSTLGTSLLVVPLLSILENISLATVFSDGKAVDATQEMLAIGLCNIGSAFVGSMPVSGALSRGAVNNASGVKTTFGGIYTGIIVLLSLQFFTPYFYYIPKSSLAAVIIAAVVFMVELHVIKPIWKAKKIDVVPAIVTFIFSIVLRLEWGIFIGVILHIGFLLYASARPSVHVAKAISIPSRIEYLMITPDRSLTFPSVEYVRNLISKAGIKQALSRLPVVIDATHIQGADFTAAKGFKSLIDDFIARDQLLIFYNLKPSVVDIFTAVEPKDFKFCRCATVLDMMLRENTVVSKSISLSDSG